MAPQTRSTTREVEEDALMPVLDSDFDTRMSPTPPPCFPSLMSTLATDSISIPPVLLEHPTCSGGTTYPLRKRAKRAFVSSDGAETELGTPRRPTALQLELAKYPRRASPVKVTSPTHSRSASSGSSVSTARSTSGTGRSTSGGSEVVPATPRRRASGRGGEPSKKRERRVSTRERIYSPEKGSGKRVGGGGIVGVGGSGGPAGRSVSDSSTVPLLHAPSSVTPSFGFVPPPPTPIYTSTPAARTTSTRPDTYTKRKALPASSSPSISRKGPNKGYKPLKSPSTPLKSPGRSRKATTSPSAKTASLGGVGGRWGTSNSASMLSVFARGLKKRMQGKKKQDKLLKAKAKAETQGSGSKEGGKEDTEGVGEMVISPPVSSIGMAGFQAEDEAWKRRGSVTMVDDADDEQEIELDSDDDDTPMSTLPRSPTTAMQFLSISAPAASNPFIDEDFEMTPASSPVSISGSMRKAQSRGKAMKVLGYEVHEAFKGALFASSLM